MGRSCRIADDIICARTTGVYRGSYLADSDSSGRDWIQGVGAAAGRCALKRHRIGQVWRGAADPDDKRHWGLCCRFDVRVDRVSHAEIEKGRLVQ